MFSRLPNHFLLVIFFAEFTKKKAQGKHHIVFLLAILVSMSFIFKLGKGIRLKSNRMVTFVGKDRTKLKTRKEQGIQDKVLKLSAGVMFAFPFIIYYMMRKSK